MPADPATVVFLAFLRFACSIATAAIKGPRWRLSSTGVPGSRCLTRGVPTEAADNAFTTASGDVLSIPVLTLKQKKRLIIFPELNSDLVLQIIHDQATVCEHGLLLQQIVPFCFQKQE